MKQVLVVPYPGRGHINPILNLCHLLSSQLHDTTFTVLVTEEWLGFINPDKDQPNIRDRGSVQFATIPNVIPSELNRGSDMISFLTAVQTKMERPFEEVIDGFEIPVDLIIADASMLWPFDVANRRNIPVVAYWPMSAKMFSLMYHVELLESHGHLYADCDNRLNFRSFVIPDAFRSLCASHISISANQRGNECIDYIPGTSSLTIADIPMLFHSGIGQKFKGLVPYPSEVTKRASYVLLSTIYELESKVIDALRAEIQIPIYTCGLNIPYSQIKSNPALNEPSYLKWLDSKPSRTVLYVSLGSFLSVTSAEMDEIIAGLTRSGVNFLWVARGETLRLQEMGDEKGMVVEWCDQLKVLLHSSIGGFWTHCGWNSVKESLFSGVPMLSFPILLDQPLNSKMIVDDWKIGWKMREKVGVFKRDEIAKLVRRFMDSKSMETIGMVERAKELQKVCQESVVEGGSATEDIDAFLRNMVTSQNK